MNQSQLLKEQKLEDIIDLCRDIEIDGETTEYILHAIGMEEQILRQLVLKSDWDTLNELVWEKRSLGK